ncbi:MAG: ABC transporter permease [Prevotella sp.]|jgi:ABC-2 type transport system permease protein
MVIKYLIKKEFLQIRRNVFLPRLIMMFPIMVMCVLPWVMNQEVKNVVVDVVDNDRSTLSQRLVHRIEQSRYFIFHGQPVSYEVANKDIERCKVDCVVEIPRHYGRDLESGRSPQVLIATNTVNGVKGSLSAGYLSQIVTRTDQLKFAPKTQEAVSTLYLFNKNLDYKVFMIPALMALLVMMLCGFLPALNIVSEKEKGTIDQINVTPVSKGTFILSKLIPYWCIALVVITVCFILSWAVYGITSAGNLGLIYLLSLLFALIFSGVGLVISNYNSTMQQAMFVMWFIVVCLLMLSGLFTPVRSMPHWAQLTTIINPMYYFIGAIRTVFVRGGDFGSISSQVAALAVFAVIMDLWAVWSYRKNA